MFDDLRELYQEIILDHGKNPRNHRHPEDANRHAAGDNPLCGDKIQVFLKLDEDNIIRDCAFEGRGCAISQASASMMTEILLGKPVAEANALFENFHQMCTDEDYAGPSADITDEDALERLQVLSGVRQFPMRVKCATLAWHTMQAAMHGEEKNGEEIVSTE
jgi:nitrogen fixation NifU-like protein